MPRRFLAGLLAIVCVLGGLPSGAVAGTVSSPDPVTKHTSPTAQPAISQDRLVTVTAERVPNTSRIRFTATFDIPHSYSNPSIYLSEKATVVETNGFEQERKTQGLAEYQVTTTYSPSITFTVNVTDQQSRYGSLGSGDDWVLGKTPMMAIQWEQNEETKTQWVFQNAAESPEFNVTAQNGIVGKELMLFGNYTTASASGEAHTFVIVTPTTLNTSPNETRALNSLTRFDNRTRFAGQDPVYMFISPAQEFGGFAYFGAEAVIGHRTELDSASNVFVHEYVHTQQQFETTQRTRWLIEGFAEYFGVKAAYTQGFSGQRGVEWMLNRTGSGELNAPETWHEELNYARGSRAIAAVDLFVQTETNDTYTVAEVFRRANQDTGQLTQYQFISIVNAVSGTDRTETWRTMFDSASPNITVVEWTDEIRQDPVQNTSKDTVTVSVETDTDTETNGETVDAEKRESKWWVIDDGRVLPFGTSEGVPIPEPLNG